MQINIERIATEANGRVWLLLKNGKAISVNRVNDSYSSCGIYDHHPDLDSPHDFPADDYKPELKRGKMSLAF